MKPRPFAAAFTLVELLASSAILAVLMLAAAACLQVALHTAADFRQHAELRRQVRVTVSALAHDFRHATVGEDTPLWLNAPPDFTAADGDAVFFFANHPAAGKSELCAVGYYPDASRQLRRYFRNSDATWQAADGHGGLLPRFINPAAPLFPAVSGAARDDALLFNLASFRVRALRDDASPITDSPLTVKPALLEITLGVRWQNFAHEFIINISGT